MLSPREAVIIRMLALAMPDKEIAGRLNLSLSSVKSSVKSIYRKLDIPVSVNRRVFLALLATKPCDCSIVYSSS